MATYAVHRKLTGITMEQLGEAQKAAIESSNKSTEEGDPVRYIRSNFYPEDASCTCLFEAENPNSVRQVNISASLPFEEIKEVLDLEP